MNTNDKPKLQDFHIEAVKHITPSNTMEALNNNKAVLIDVREETEVRIENIPLDNVLYHPMSVIMDRLEFISKDQNIILGCPGGVRSTKVANLLNRQGYPNVANLDGGFSKWKEQGFPFKSNISYNTIHSGCGCSCSSSKTEIEDGGCC